MTRYVLPLSLVLALPVFAQSPPFKACQPNFADVLEIHAYNSRKAPPPTMEPTPPLPNQYKMIVVAIPATRTPGPVINGTPVCTDPASTYIQVDGTQLDGPGVWNQWFAFAISKDDPTLNSDRSNVVVPPGSKAFAPVLY